MTKSYDKETQSLGLTGIGNARDLGGYQTMDGHTIRRGVLLRSAAINTAIAEDCRILNKRYNLTRILDLRMEHERKQKSWQGGTAASVHEGAITTDQADFSFAHIEQVPILNEEQMTRDLRGMEEELKRPLTILESIQIGLEKGMVGPRMYVDFLEDSVGKQGFGTALRRIAEQPEHEAILWHCTQGKDRTGLVAMLVLSVLGVDEDTIIFDYLLTNEFNASIIAKEEQMARASGITDEQIDALMIGLDRVYPITMQNALNHLRQTYGSVLGYVHDALDVTNEECEIIRHKYLLG